MSRFPDKQIISSLKRQLHFPAFYSIMEDKINRNEAYT